MFAPAAWGFRQGQPRKSGLREMSSGRIPSLRSVDRQRAGSVCLMHRDAGAVGEPADVLRHASEGEGVDLAQAPAAHDDRVGL